MPDKNQVHASMPQNERGLELAKLHLDTFKHITTFCSGAILLTATVVAALFPDPIRVWALTLSLLFFVGGVTFAPWGFSVYDLLTRRPPANAGEQGLERALDAICGMGIPRGNVIRFLRRG